MIKNNELIHPFDVTSNESGKTYQLTPNSSKSVQPVALLRLSVFTPVGTKENRDRNFEVDASDELSCMEIARSEGYDDIKITGVKLSMSTDFKCWLGIIMAFSKYGFTYEKISLTFNEFAKMCGISSTNINKRTRARFKESLMNLASVVLAFSDSRSGRFTVTHLVQKAMIDPKSDTVELVGDPSMWELYRYDHKTLLSLQVLYILAKKEAAQSLYIYFEAMPAGTLFVNMKRLRERLLLTTPIRTQNQIIRKAMRELESIGYLDYQEVKKGRDIQFQIFKRSPKLALAKQG
ncbi:RepB family plasmid replication initiator protein (plasmid) [Enterobacter hormaechei]|uniref:RepB family plasmid replication initiator protein n=1 Tax=Enterobacter hormaechei TaxID=158836 RepID=UPI001F366FAA